MRTIRNATLMACAALMAFFPQHLRACDGQCYDPPFSNGTCACVSTAPPAPTSSCGPATVISISGHYACGGTDSEWCNCINMTVGTETPCTKTTSTLKQIACYAQYQACVSGCGVDLSCINGCYQYADPCCWTTCTTGTSTPLSDCVYVSSGGTCGG